MAFRQTIGAIAALGFCCLAAPLAGAWASTEGPSAVVVLSSDRAGARPVVTIVRLRYEMQCAWPGPGPLTIRLPAEMSVPLAIASSAVLIDGKPAKRLGKSGHRVVLALPPRPEILCDVIAPGTLTATFTRAARLGNPVARGTYRLRGTKGSLTFHATLTIR
jgi:hypothetical protein